jgi:DNA-binding transcriptional LysR family regulator
MSLSTPITIEALRVLDTIEKRGSYAAAAEQLDKVPSALSYIVQKLEEQLGVTLFQKQGRRSVLTPAGRHLLDEGRLILDAAERLGEQTRNIANGYESKIRLAIDTIINSSEIYEVLAEFMAIHPGIELDVREESLGGAWEVLINDEVDMVIGATDPIPQNRGVRAIAIAQSDLIYVASKDHPLAKSTTPIRQEQLQQTRQVVIRDSIQTGVPWSRGLLNLQQHFYVRSMHSKIMAQLAGIGAGYLPRQRIKNHLQDGSLIELTLENQQARPANKYIAWKVVNQGKGLQLLRELFLAHTTLRKPTDNT